MKLLIIEDDIELLNSLAESLKQDCFTVITAQTGKIALQKYVEDVFDLVLLDLNLPDMDGIDILEKIRKSKSPSVHVLILTAKYELENKVIGLDAGADDYLAKPFSIVELKARIRAILRRSSTNKQIKLHINNIEINVAERKVLKDNTEINLTPKEFSILELFFYNKNSILTPTQIAEHIYTDYFEKSSHIINMHIKNIRTKLQNQTIIETIRGVGFRLNS